MSELHNDARALPRRTPNARPATLAPLNFFALTKPTAGGVADIDDELIWLTREYGVRVAKDGIHLGGRRYWSAELMPYVTAAKAKRRSPYVVWYDEAALSAGKLTEIIFGQLDGAGSQRPMFKVPVNDAVVGHIDPAMVLEARHRYERMLAAKVSDVERRYIERDAGAHAVERLLELQQERKIRMQERVAADGPPRPVLGVGQQEEAQQRHAVLHAGVAAMRDEIPPQVQDAKAEASDETTAEKRTTAKKPRSSKGSRSKQQQTAASRSRKGRSRRASAAPSAPVKNLGKSVRGAYARQQRPRTSATADKSDMVTMLAALL